MGLLEKTGGFLFAFMSTPSNAGTDYSKERAWEKKRAKQNQKRRADREESLRGIDNYLRRNFGSGYGGFSVDAPTFPEFSISD